MASKPKSKRNYAKEYLIRIARGLAGGKSRAQARGHARAADLPGDASPRPFRRSEPLEDALKLMKKGVSQRNAAKLARVSPERLRRFQKANTASHREGRRWIISDTRPVPFVMATRGRMRDVIVPHDATGDISRHWIAINLFLESNDPSHLALFVGKGLRDTSGAFHPFETRPNVLRKLDSVGELSFVDIYRQMAQQLERAAMDDFDRFMSRQRALRRGRIRSGRISSLWDFKHWDDGRTQEHHPGRERFSTEVVVTVPTAMHLELTRRGEEEHPPLGPDPGNLLERRGRLHLGLSDMHAGLSDVHRQIGEAQLAAVEAGHADLNAVQIPKGLLGWIERIAHDLARVTDGMLENLRKE